jgi:hypothetical protein
VTYCKQGTDVINKRKAYEDLKDLTLHMNNIGTVITCNLIIFSGNDIMPSLWVCIRN